jgi:outer membrane protein assembly factor BamB
MIFMIRQDHNYQPFPVNKFNYLVIFFSFVLLVNCSVIDPVGVWKSSEKEIKRVADLEKKQKEIVNTEKIYTGDNIFAEEKNLNTKIILSKPKNILKWEMSGLNYQNSLGNIYLSGSANNFLKKKIGKNKFSYANVMNSPLTSNKRIYFSDNNGTIYSTNQIGDIIWKKNIYQKLYKKIYKNLSLAIYKKNIYVSDNIGFIYSISLDNGKLNWIKNHGIPLKSKIKVFDDKIFLINQDNRIISFNSKDGSIIWNIRSIPSFIKLQNLLSLAISNQGHLVSIDTSGTLTKANTKDGRIFWTINIADSVFAHSTDFFKATDVVIDNNKVFVSTASSISSLDLATGYNIWTLKISSADTPIISGKNMFIVTKNGFFVIIDINNGEIISSKNILTILKKRKRSTIISGFIMGSNKIYALTHNGYTIVCSATTGKPEYFIKIGETITSTPIISNGNLYIRTKKSKIFGFN